MWGLQCGGCGVAEVPAPTGLSATDGSYPDKVEVSWDVVVNADQYKVYRADNPSGTKTLLGNRTGTSLNDTSGLVGVTYYYYVKSCYQGTCGLQFLRHGLEVSGRSMNLRDSRVRWESLSCNNLLK